VVLQVNIGDGQYVMIDYSIDPTAPLQMDMGVEL
jgi:hypothetical protein